jgi:hypothetical protein
MRIQNLESKSTIKLLLVRLFLGEIDILKTILPLTLLQEESAVPTRCGISKRPLVCHAIVMNSHDIQVTVSKLTKISYLLDNIPFCMDRILGESTALGS